MKYAFYVPFHWISLALLLLFPAVSRGQITIDSAATADYLVNNVLLGGNIQATNATMRGHTHAIRSFTNTNVPLGMGNGILLSTGSAHALRRPNDYISWFLSDLDQPGDSLLSRMAGMKTHDAAVLEFDFVPGNDSIYINFIYASDEYGYDAIGQYHDIVAIHLSGPGFRGRKNLALVPGTTSPVSSQTINKRKNNTWYIDNNPINSPGRPGYNKLNPLSQLLISRFPQDGLTRLITAKSVVIPGKTYHLRIAIADFPDAQFSQSTILLQAGGFTSLDSLPVPDPLVDGIPAALRQPPMPWTPKPAGATPATSSKDPDADKKPKVMFTSIVNFASAATDIDPSETKGLDEVARYALMDTSWHIYLIGHTDNEGDQQFNQQLSRQRAEEIRAYLVARGVAADHIRYSWRGENSPVASNGSDDGRAANRRVMVYVVKVL